MKQNLLKLIDTGQTSYNAWEHGLKHVREGAENGSGKNRRGNY